MIIEGFFSYFSLKPRCDPSSEQPRRDGSNERSQHLFFFIQNGQ